MSKQKEYWNNKFHIKKAKKSLQNKMRQVSYLMDDKLNFIQPFKDYIDMLLVVNSRLAPSTTNSICNSLRYYAIFLAMEDKKFEDAVTDIQLLWRFRQWLLEPLRFSGLNISTLKRFELKENGETDALEVSSMNMIISRVSSVYKWMHDTGAIAKNPVSYRKIHVSASERESDLLDFTKKEHVKSVNVLKIKNPHTEKELPVLSKEQFKIFVNCCKSIRDKLICILLYEGGLRIGELLGLRLEDIDFLEKGLNVVHRDDNINGARAKAGAGRDRFVTLDPATMVLIDDYLNEERITVDAFGDYLFVNIKSPRKEDLGNPMSKSNIQSLFNSLSRRAFGVNEAKKKKLNVHPHMFRHSNATNLVKGYMKSTGVVDWKVVSEHLGHQCAETTRNTYVHLTAKDVKEEIEKLGIYTYIDKENFNEL